MRQQDNDIYLDKAAKHFYNVVRNALIIKFYKAFQKRISQKEIADLFGMDRSNISHLLEKEEHEQK